MSRCSGWSTTTASSASCTGADIAFVSQRYEGSEFNIPSKLMNFMAYGLPVLAAVNPAGEVARIVTEADAGWVVDSSDPDAFPRELARLAGGAGRGPRSGRRAHGRYAERHFTQAGFAERFEQTLLDVAGRRADRRPSEATGVAAVTWS